MNLGEEKGLEGTLGRTATGERRKKEKGKVFLGKKTILGFGLVVLSIATLCLQSASAVRTAPVETNDARQAEAEREYQLVQSKLLELEQDPEALFHKFVREHNKKYEDETERAYRLGVFKVSTTYREREREELERKPSWSSWTIGQGKKERVSCISISVY